MAEFPGTRWTEIAAAQQGDSTALRAIALKYRPVVVSYLARRGFPADAEDLAQEVFLRLFSPELLAKVDPTKGRFRNLLLAITRHVAGQHLEKSAAKKRGGGRVQPLGKLEVASPQPDPEFDREWLQHLLSVSLERLAAENPKYHAALERALVQNKNHADISAELGCSLGDVKNYVHRGRKRVIRYLQEEVRRYSGSPEEYSDELEHLSQLLKRQGLG